MYRCILIHRQWSPDSLLERYIRHTDCLDLEWSGSYSDEAFQKLQSEPYHLIFASLPSPGYPGYEEILSEFRSKNGVILTSPYPKHLFVEYELNPLVYLTEPISINQFQSAIEKFMNDAA